MLVLTRKTQERIEIGGGITVTVLRIKGKSVRLGIEAPKGCGILRGELSARLAQSVGPFPETHRGNQIAMESRDAAPLPHAHARSGNRNPMSISHGLNQTRLVAETK